MTLDQRLAEAARQVADGVTPPEVDLDSVRTQGRARRRRAAAAATFSVVVAIAVLVALFGRLGATSSRPEPVEPPGGTVPTTTQRVYVLAQPWADCGYLDESFLPLTVAGPGYRTTVTPTEACLVHTPKSVGFPVTTYAYDVPMPEVGKVTVTPGDQPAAVLDAAKVARRSGATVWYTLLEFGVYEVSFIMHGKRVGGR
jgi:hypothetical protein